MEWRLVGRRRGGRRIGRGFICDCNTRQVDVASFLDEEFQTAEDRRFGHYKLEISGKRKKEEKTLSNQINTNLAASPRVLTGLLVLGFCWSTKKDEKEKSKTPK